MAKTYVVFIEVKTRQIANNLIDELMSDPDIYGYIDDYEIDEFSTDNYIDKYIR